MVIKKRLGSEARTHWPSLVKLYILDDKVSKPTGLSKRVAGCSLTTSIKTTSKLINIAGLICGK